MTHVPAVEQRKRASRHVDIEIADLASRQHGVVSRSQLLQLGATAGVIRHRISTSRFRLLHRNVYLVGVLRPTVHGQFMAAVLTHGPNALLSHRAAAALWDISAIPSGPIDVTILRQGGARRRAGVLVHHSRRLGPEQRTKRDGIPCTTIERTLIDLAGQVSTNQLHRVLERAQHMGRLNMLKLRPELERAPGKRGVAALRRVLEGIADEPPRFNSDLEVDFRDFLAKHGLPRPIVNGLVLDYEVDFHWPAARLVVETDGRATHATGSAFESDRRRDLDLELAGWTVVRVTCRMLRERPDRIAERLRRSLHIQRQPTERHGQKRSMAESDRAREGPVRPALLQCPLKPRR